MANREAGDWLGQTDQGRKLLRELGLVGLAASAAVAIVGVATKVHQPATTAVTATAPTPLATPAPPATPPPPTPAPAGKLDPNRQNAPLKPGNAAIYTAGNTEAYTVIVGKRGNMTVTEMHELGDYQNLVEYMKLLKVRDPKMYKWQVQQWGEQGSGTTLWPHPPGGKVAGVNEAGLPIYEGQTVVAPLRPRTTEQIEQNYRGRYEWTRQAYLKEQNRKKEFARIEANWAKQAKEKGMTIAEYKEYLATKHAHDPRTGPGLAQQLKTQAAGDKAGKK